MAPAKVTSYINISKGNVDVTCNFTLSWVYIPFLVFLAGPRVILQHAVLTSVRVLDNFSNEFLIAHGQPLVLLLTFLHDKPVWLQPVLCSCLSLETNLITV